MRYFRVAGILVLGLLLLPVAWAGYGGLADALAAPGAARAGGVCVIDGVTPVVNAYVLGHSTPTLNLADTQTFTLVEGYGGYCRLDRSVDSALSQADWWQLNGATYPEGYDGDLNAQNFPPLEWQWPIKLTWADESRSLAPGRWSTKILSRTLPLTAFLSILAVLGLTIREYSLRGRYDDEGP